MGTVRYIDGARVTLNCPLRIITMTEMTTIFCVEISNIMYTQCTYALKCLFTVKRKWERKRSSKSIRPKTKFTLNWPLNMAITSVKIKRGNQHSIRRQLNLIPMPFSVFPILQRKSPGTRLVLTYAVKGQEWGEVIRGRVSRSVTRTVDLPLQPDKYPLVSVEPPLNSVRARVVWCHSLRAHSLQLRPLPGFAL